MIAAAGVLAQGCRLGQGPLLTFWEMLLSWYPLPLGLSGTVLAAGAVIQLLARNMPDRL